MLEMTREEKSAYEWAIKQSKDHRIFGIVVARILADYIDRNTNAQVSQVIQADPGSTIQGVKQTIIR